MTKKCIYCLRCESDTLKFNRDHICPTSLGKFKSSPPRLKMCIDCNTKHFSKHETVFGRGTIYAVMRARKKIKTTGMQWDSKHSECSVYEEGVGNLLVAPQYVHDGQIYTTCIDQIHIEKSDGLKLVFPINNTTLDELKNSSVNLKIDKYSFILHTPFAESTKKILKNIGVDLDAPTGGFSSKALELEGSGRLSIRTNFGDDLLAVAAKFAFNYFAWKYPELIYKSEFDSVRRWIRYGEGNNADFISLQPHRIIYNNSSIAQDGGHVVMLRHRPDGYITSKICLFNCDIDVTYEVMLGHYLERVISPSFCYYDISSMTAFQGVNFSDLSLAI